MGFYRKRPLVIEARQINAENWSQVQETATWAGADIVDIDTFLAHGDMAVLVIPTLEGLVYAEDGDWVIKGFRGEFYPCKPDIFDATYDPMVRL